MKYVPILRFRSIENTLLSDEIKNSDNIIPLLEIVDEEIFEKFIANTCNKFDKLMVELPIYLSERPNKYQTDVLDILNKYESSEEDSQISFYKDCQKDKNFNLVTEDYPDLGFIPVISTIPRNITYSDFISKYNNLKNLFNEVAFRFFVYSTDITPEQKENILTISNSIRDNDIILLDILGFENVEGQIRKNLEEIISMLNEKQIYILNAFDYNGNNDTHNYSPLIAKELNTSGFGDFATTVRYEAGGGGGGQTKRIRFYEYNNHNLIHFQHESSYTGATQFLKQSQFWKEIIREEENHLSICSYCNAIEQDIYNNGHSWWKQYRIMHYINSILNHTIPNMSQYDNAEDFDSDGYNDIVKKMGTISEMG